MSSSRFYLGLDLGQAQDYSALVIAERIEQPVLFDERDDQLALERAVATGTRYRSLRGQTKRVEHRYDVRHIHRFPLGTPYPAVVEHVQQLMRHRELRSLDGGPTPVVDNTGVGRAVIDLFKAADLEPLTAVTITGGNSVTYEGGSYHVPKHDLVSVVAVLLQSERLRIARDLPHAETRREELVNFRVTINSVTAHDSYNAREGQHDDLVLALAVALWYAEKQARSDVTGKFEPIYY